MLCNHNSVLTLKQYTDSFKTSIQFIDLVDEIIFHSMVTINDNTNGIYKKRGKNNMLSFEISFHFSLEGIFIKLFCKKSFIHLFIYLLFILFQFKRSLLYLVTCKIYSLCNVLSYDYEQNLDTFSLEKLPSFFFIKLITDLRSNDNHSFNLIKSINNEHLIHLLNDAICL